MIVLTDAHVAEIISALKSHEEAIIKEAGEEVRGGRWSVSAREAHDRTHQALVGFIEERDRYPGTDHVLESQGPKETWPTTDEDRVEFVDWQYEVGNGDTVLGFREWQRTKED